MRRWLTALLGIAICGLSAAAQKSGFNGERAYETARDLVAIGPRPVGSQGHDRAVIFLKKQFAHDALEDDRFSANTPAGLMTMHNLIVRFKGTKPGIIVVASHYDTNYPLRNTTFAGANDGAATCGLLVELARAMRGKTLAGPSVWLVLFDGEEAVETWTRSDSTYGSRHLAAKWQNDGTLKHLKAFILTDMIGDKDLDIMRETNSTPWLQDAVEQAARKLGYSKYFFAQSGAVEDDHLPFVQRGVPSVDIIDLNYGPANSYHHTVEDTMDKISAKSLTVSGSVVQETIRLVSAR